MGTSIALSNTRMATCVWPWFIRMHFRFGQLISRTYLKPSLSEEPPTVASGCSLHQALHSQLWEYLCRHFKTKRTPLLTSGSPSWERWLTILPTPGNKPKSTSFIVCPFYRTEVLQLHPLQLNYPMERLSKWTAPRPAVPWGRQQRRIAKLLNMNPINDGASSWDTRLFVTLVEHSVHFSLRWRKNIHGGSHSNQHNIYSSLCLMTNMRTVPVLIYSMIIVLASSVVHIMS